MSRTRLDALLAGGACGPLAGDCRIIETHVSWVVLSGALAWKIKKPVNLGFLDFSSLAARRHACEEELRLNRRLAPDLYLDVVELRAQPPASGADRPEPIVEYAVKMRRFPDGAAVGSALAASLTAAEAVQLGGLIGGFHGTLPRDLPFREWGSADATWAAIDSSLLQMSGLVAGGMQERVNRCRSFLGSEFARRRGFITERQRSGAVRECHGDLHLGNLVRLEGRIVPFDALEFDPALRWIDVMNEVAFLLMDLDVRARRDLAFHFLNSWLDATGDFAKVADIFAEIFARFSSTADQNFLLNINIPMTAKDAGDIKWAKLGRRIYRDNYKREVREDGSMLLNLGGSVLSHGGEADTDFDWYDQGFTVITPLTIDATDHKKLTRHRA